MYSYFLFIAVICFTTFQAFFTYNTATVRTIMFMVTLEGAYILTKVSIAAARLATEVRSCFQSLPHFSNMFGLLFIILYRSKIKLFSSRKHT